MSSDNDSVDEHAEERELWLREQDVQLARLEEKDDLRIVHFVISEDNQPSEPHEGEERIRRIGKALEYATHVRQIELWFGGYYEFVERTDVEEEMQEEGVLLQRIMSSTPNHGSIGLHSGIINFVRTSKSLRTVHFGNLCDETSIFVDFTSRYIEAVQDNPNITSFRWEGFDILLVPTLCDLITTTKSIQSMEIEGGEEGNVVLSREHLRDLCMAFAANTSLKSVTFDGISFNYGPGEIDLEMPQNKIVKELKFQRCEDIDMKSASTFLHIFPVIEKLSTCALQPFTVYFSKMKNTALDDRPSNIRDFQFLGDVDNVTPKLKDFIAMQARLERLNCAYTTKPSHQESSKIIKSITEGVATHKKSALKSLFLDNFVIPKQALDKMDEVVKGLEEMEFHFHFRGNLPPKAMKWISDPECNLKLLRLNLYRLGEHPLRDLFSALGQNKRIEVLQVKNLEASDTFLKPVLEQCLSGMTGLRKLTTTSASMVRAFCYMKDNNVTELEIESHHLSRNGILDALLSFLPRHDCKLKRLTVSNLCDEKEEDDNDDNYEEDPNVENQVKIVDVLSRNHSLEYLRLNGLEPSIPLFNLAVVLPSLKTLKELSITISQLWEVEPTTLFGLKTALLRGLGQNKCLTSFECDLDYECYSFQRDIIVLCLRNKIRAFAPEENVEIPKEILQHAADFLL